MELHQNQAGDGAIAIGGVLQPAQDLFAMAVAECDAADGFEKYAALTSDGSFKRNLGELPAMFEKVTVVVSSDCSGSGGVMEGAYFPYSTCGGYIWWKVSWLYECIGLSSHGGSCRWVQAIWPTWVNLASELGLKPVHARRSMPSNAQQAGAGDRVLDWPSVSSHLLVGILARFAYSSASRGGLRAVDKRAGVRSLLSDLVENRAFVRRGHTHIFPTMPSGSRHAIRAGTA